MNSPDPTVEIWQQRPLLEEEIFVRRLPFPDQAGRGSVKALIAIDGAGGSIVEESREVEKRGAHGYGDEL